MRATRDEKAEFGRLLTAALEAHGMSQAELRSRLELRAGILKSAQAVSNWVSGTFAPDRRTTQALDSILETSGRLMRTLGYSTDPLEGTSWIPSELLNWMSSLSKVDQVQVVRLVKEVARKAADETADRVTAQLLTYNYDAVLEQFALAASDGSADPHDDDVGEPSVGHPGGADITEAPGA